MMRRVHCLLIIALLVGGTPAARAEPAARTEQASPGPGVGATLLTRNIARAFAFDDRIGDANFSPAPDTALPLPVRLAIVLAVYFSGGVVGYLVRARVGRRRRRYYL